MISRASKDADSAQGDDATDITAEELARFRSLGEQRRAEVEHLREQQDCLERALNFNLLAFDDAAVPLLVLKENGVICLANRAFAQLLGRDRSAIVDQGLRMFVHPIDRAVWGKHLSESWSVESSTCELRLSRADGKLMPVRLTSMSGGLSATGHFLNVALRDLRDDEAMARATRQLVRAERRAREASESKDELIAMLSHELRTPLTPVLAAASSLKTAKGVSPEVRRVFAMIERNIRTEARLIDDLLDATGLSRGKISLVRQPLDLRELVGECREHLSTIAEDKGIALTLNWEASHSYVNGDAVRLRQVFFNLLTNALKFTNPGGHVIIRSWNREGLIIVEVEDDGAGFNPAEATRLFTAFEQGETRAMKGGLGLGLAICRGILDLHEGRIDALSRGTGQGARFVVELSNVAAVPSTAPEAPESQPARALHILLIEDDDDTATILVELLQMHGFTVEMAGSMRAALAIDLDPVDAIISDLGLPDGSGFDLIGKLSTKAKRPSIALSGFGMAKDIERAIEAGFDRHLTKPVDITRLVAALRAIT